MLNRFKKYFLSLFFVSVVLFPCIYFSYPFKQDKCCGIQITFPEGEIIHSPHSLAACRKMWNEISDDEKKDSIIRIAVISSDPQNFLLRDSVAEILRKLFNDPRNNYSWQWSKNWSLLKNNSGSPFNRPSIFVNSNPGAPQHDYISGWIQFKKNSTARNSLLRIIYKNKFPQISSTFSSDSATVLQQNFCDDGNWHMLTWPMNSDSGMITIDGRESPEIGSISAEPEKGFSIWTIKIPGKLSASSLLHYRHQLELVSPRLIILTSTKNDSLFINSIGICKKIAREVPIILFSEYRNTQAEEFAWNNGCAFIYGKNFYQTCFWKFALQKDITGCFRL